MTKEKTALVIPNAIQICTISEKFFFCSFATRKLIYYLWKITEMRIIILSSNFKKRRECCRVKKSLIRINN